MLADNEEFIVRSCSYEEIPKVITINESTLPENYPTYFYEQILEKYPESFLIAELSNSSKSVVGYVMWRIERGISSFGIQLVKKGHLVSISVCQEYRRKGIASKLLIKSMENVLVSKVDEFVLEVRISNQSAIILYENFR